MSLKSQSRRWVAIFAFTSWSVLIPAQQYFPNGAIDSKNADSDAFKNEWYSKQLKALEEPSLYELSKNEGSEAYRFLWLRTFHHPIAVRITLNADGTAVLVKKMCNGAGGYDPGKLILNREIALSQQQVQSLQRKVEEVGYWQLPARKDVLGLDGAQWIIEAVKDGKYHLVDRWSPAKGPVRTLGWMIAHELAKLEIKSGEVY